MSVFEIIRNLETNRVERMVKKFGSFKKLEISFFNVNGLAYLHFTDSRKGKSVSLSSLEWQELTQQINTIAYAINLVETDGATAMQEIQQQDPQQQQLQQLQQQQEPQHQAASSYGVFPPHQEGPPAKKTKSPNKK